MSVIKAADAVEVSEQTRYKLAGILATPTDLKGLFRDMRAIIPQNLQTICGNRSAQDLKG